MTSLGQQTMVAQDKIEQAAAGLENVEYAAASPDMFELSTAGQGKVE